MLTFGAQGLAGFTVFQHKESIAVLVVQSFLVILNFCPVPPSCSLVLVTETRGDLFLSSLPQMKEELLYGWLQCVSAGRRKTQLVI